MMKAEYKKLIIFLTVSAFFGAFSGSILPIHYLDNGISIVHMSIASVITWIAQLVALLFIRRLKSNKSLVIAIVFSMIQILLIIHIFSIWQFYLSAILFGLHIHLYYTPYNVIHLQNTDDKHSGASAGLMFTIWAVVGFVTPLIAGLVADFNIAHIWIMSGVLFLLTLWTIKPLKNVAVSYSLKESWTELKSLKSIFIIQGFCDAIFRALIPLYTLQFIHTPTEYGAFLSYIALAGGAGNLLFAQFTDRIHMRSPFLYPVTLILGILTILYPLAATSLKLWLIFAGILSLIGPTFNTLCFTLMIDKKLDLMKAVPGREITLAIGRIIGFSAVVVSFIYELQPHYIFYVLGAGALMLPTVLFIKSEVLRSSSYL